MPGQFKKRRSDGWLFHRSISTCLLATCAIWLMLPSFARGQDNTNSEPPRDETTVREAGGRLIVSGETIVVTGDTEPRTSSIATKTDVPLIETPRSVSIVDRHTLDEQAAINVTTAHD